MDKLTLIIEVLEEEFEKLPKTGTMYDEGYRAGVRWTIFALRMANGTDLCELIKRREKNE